MSLNRYSVEEKERALEITETDGARAAARAIGCSHTTVLRWWADAEVERSTEQKAEREQQRKDRIAAVQGRNRLRLAEVAAQHIDASAEAENSLDAQRWMTAAAIALDKLAAKTGAESSRPPSGVHEGFSPEDEAELDQTLMELVGQMEQAVRWAAENGMPDPRTAA